MTAHDRLVALRRSIALTLVARAIITGLAAALVVFAIGRIAGWGMWTTAIVLVAFGAVAATSTHTLTGARSLTRVALWVEERTPSLRYALVTVADGAQSPALEAQALGTDWWTEAQRALLRSLVMPASAAVAVSQRLNS